jgi:hypothetical protein
MDFKGQELFELISWLAAIIVGMAAFASGYVKQDFSLMAAIYGIGASQSTSHDLAAGVS